jgi:hypothetical protein
MNDKDRNYLIRLQKILEAVPFSASGVATTTGYGAVMFEQDMRALRPYVRKAIEGLVMRGNSYLEEGLDFYNPDQTLDLIEAWIERRKKEGWQNASQ